MSVSSICQFVRDVAPESRKLWCDAITSFHQDGPTFEDFIAHKVVGLVRFAAVPFCVAAEVPNMAVKEICDHALGKDEISWDLSIPMGNNARFSLFNVNVKGGVGWVLGRAVGAVAYGMFAGIVAGQLIKSDALQTGALFTVPAAFVGFERVFCLNSCG
jgi:hypothetical protein